MAYTYRSSSNNEEQPQQIHFSNTGNSRFAGETPFRPGNSNSSGLFTPTPGKTKSRGRGLFSNYISADSEEEGVRDEEEDDEDGEYEIEETPITKSLPGYTKATKKQASRSESHTYSSPTDGDDEESPYTNGDDEEDDETEHAKNEDLSIEDEEVQEDTEEEEEEEGDEGDSGDGGAEDVVMEEGSQQQRQSHRHRGYRKGLVSSTETFLRSNPPLLITRSNNILRSLASLLALTDECEDPLPEASPVHRKPPITAGKKIGYLAKYISIFLSDLQSVSSSVEEPSVFNAHYLGSLLLNIQHPSAQSTRKPNPTPSPIEVFKYFLDTHHPNPMTGELQALYTYHPTPCASPEYWPVIAHLALRGELAEVNSLLRKKGWDNIVREKSKEEPQGSFKYSESEADVIERIINAAIKVVSAAPELFVKGRELERSAERSAEWWIYRGRVHAAIDELRSLSHNSQGVDGDEDEAEYRWETIATTRNGFSARERQKVRQGNRVRGDNKPLTRVPKDVEAGLMSIYLILTGNIERIIEVAERWQEAVLGASIWRRYLDEEDVQEDSAMDDSPNFSGLFNRSLRARSIIRAAAPRGTLNQRSGVHRSKHAYNELETLKNSFDRITSKDLPIDLTNIREVGTGHILKGNWKALVDLLISREDRMVAFTVAEFIVEVAKLAGWSTAGCEDFDTDRGNYFTDVSGFRNEDWNNVNRVLNKMGNFSDSEAERSRKAKKWEETVVEGHVRYLVRTGVLVESTGGMEGGEEFGDKSVEGWEIGVEILQRWATLTIGDELEWSRKLAAEILSSLPLTSTEQVEKMLRYCKSYSLQETYTSVAAAYASHLYASSELGSSLLYYSRAGNKSKIHSILTRLCSQSLLLSSVYPPEDKLDPVFRELLERPMDEEDDILRFELSGYAALRTFYDAREQGDKEVAARALVALIRSAGEMVDGGAGIDEEWESPVEWWMGGVLLGELLCFVSQEKRWLAIREMMDVLKVVQDLTGAIRTAFPSQSSQVTHQAETFLRKCLLAYKNPSDIPRLLKLSTGSSLSSMVSSSMLNSWQHLEDPDIDRAQLSPEEEDEDGFAIINLEELEEVKRGWDWRENMVHILDKGKKPPAPGHVLETVVRIVRMGLAKELAKGWLDGHGELGVPEVMDLGAGVAGVAGVAGIAGVAGVAATDIVVSVSPAVARIDTEMGGIEV